MKLPKGFSFSVAIFFLVCSSRSSFATSVFNHLLYPEESEKLAPWFTGPLLAPSANTIPKGHINIEPYVYFLASTSSYNEHWHKNSRPGFYSLIVQNFIQIGMNSCMSLQFTPSLYYQFTQGVRSTQAGDLPFSISFQLTKDRLGEFLPSTRLILQASYPGGKYRYLNPSLLGTDGVGSGSWNPALGLAFSKLFEFPNNRFLSLRFVMNYTVPTPVAARGATVYGGGPGTHGTVYPGKAFASDFAFEYTLTRSWVVAADLYYVHTNKTHFSGQSPTTPIRGTGSEQLSLAPAIEYNKNINFGIITGVWFTVTGKNARSFQGSVTAFNFYF